MWRHVDYCFRLGGLECASVVTYGLIVSNWVARTVLVCGYCFNMVRWTIIVSNWVVRSVLVWRHMDCCFRLGGSECASVVTYGLLFQTGWLGVLVWRHVDYCFKLGGSKCATVCSDIWTIVSNWVARTVLVWRHMDYCFNWVARKCASVATCGLLFQTGWLGVC